MFFLLFCQILFLVILLLLILFILCADSGSTKVESTVLPAVRAPVKFSEPLLSNSPQTKEQSSSSSHTAAEAWLEEAHREAGFSKPYTVSI